MIVFNNFEFFRSADITEIIKETDDNNIADLEIECGFMIENQIPVFVVFIFVRVNNPNQSFGATKIGS